MKSISILPITRQFGKALRLLLKNDPLRLAGATAFFTTFALPPILLIMILLLGLLFNRRSISRQLFGRLADIVGRESVHEIVGTLKAFRGLAVNWPIAIGGFIFLVFVATTLFKVIQSSFNQLWMIRRTGENKFRMAMGSRLKSFIVILFTGLLFMTSLFFDSMQLIFGKYVTELMPNIGWVFNNALSIVISIVIVWVWFTMIFRYLPDGKPTWKVAMTGALLTSILFNLGKYLLGWLLPNSNIGVVYGTSASIVLLLLFVFYSSIILYYGAAFTKVWSVHINQPIKPVNNAKHYVNVAGEDKENEQLG
ncbi:MAG: inner rane protein YihY, formerly thought to be RNase [Ferruginibacter sp.]|nr:inner rane protein YihY, formerly thought to be RNase [Ferruginibacter sp.]